MEGLTVIKKIIATAAAISLLAANAALADAAPQSTYTLQISGFVPVICRAQLSTTEAPSQAGQISLGQMNELCNNANGFEVWVDYSPDLAGDTLEVDGQQIVLTSAGTARIDVAQTAAIATKNVALDVPENGQSGSLSFRVVTL
jgi:hypothetical protein